MQFDQLRVHTLSAREPVRIEGDPDGPVDPPVQPDQLAAPAQLDVDPLHVLLARHAFTVLPLGEERPLDVDQLGHLFLRQPRILALDPQQRAEHRSDRVRAVALPPGHDRPSNVKSKLENTGTIRDLGQGAPG